MIQKILHNTIIQISVIAAAILLLYFRTLSYDFIGLDEQSLLIDKRNFNKELSNIPQAFTQHVFQKENSPNNSNSNQYYRPILTVSFILDEQFADGGFTFHHFTNLLIHFFAAIGLLFVLIQMKIPQSLAFLFALIFTSHPLLVQAIAWIPGRNDSLVCAFILWSFYFLTTFQKNAGRMLLHLLFFTLALFTKENAVVFSVLCTFYILVIQAKNFTAKDKTILLASYATLLLIWFAARSHAIDNLSLPFSEKGGSFTLLLQYLQKTIIPVNLSVMSAVNDTNYGWVLLSLIIFGSAIYFTKHISWNEISFGLLWYVLFLLPTLLFSYFEGMEHRTYLPMVGLLIAIAHTGPVQQLGANTTKLLLIFAPFIFLFGILTFNRVPVFANELSYWENAFLTSQNSAVVCRDYGVILTRTEQYEKAEKVFTEGIKRDSKEILIHYNLSVLYLKTQHYAEAERHLFQELNLDSTSNPMSYHVLGVIYKRTGRMKEAIAMWQKALKVSPGFQPAMEELRIMQESDIHNTQ